MRLTLAIFLLVTSAFSQSRTVPLDFVPIIDGRSYSSETDAKTVSVCKFYVSDIVLFSNGKRVFESDKSYFLIDFSEPASLHRTLAIPDGCHFDKIRFTLGIDAATNENGVGDGDLDPVRGMYWAWQSGYINMKLEGAINGKTFEYHLGGFQQPFLSCRAVEISSANDAILIKVDPMRFLKKVPTEITHVMSPGKTAMQLSDLAVNMFYR
ncbi:MAG: hypothetical protein EOO48_10030 [Flavobacterium sp.]|nr:MAG: hypothetical protein EOO48_10030 [Flavobacterium sp.]